LKVLESKWTDLFLASLPPWFVQRLHHPEGYKNQPLGMIRMAVHAEILDTCKEIKFQKAISDPLKAGSYKDLCKQQNLQPPDWDQPSKHLKRGYIALRNILVPSIFLRGG
jgi:hypothetical protein